jgi:hypothetical protein
VPLKELAKNHSFDGSFIVETAHRSPQSTETMKRTMLPVSQGIYLLQGRANGYRVITNKQLHIFQTSSPKDEIDLAVTQIEKQLKANVPEICFATLGEDAGIIGAAALALHTKQQGKLK